MSVKSRGSHRSQVPHCGIRFLFPAGDPPPPMRKKIVPSSLELALRRRKYISHVESVRPVYTSELAFAAYIVTSPELDADARLLANPSICPSNNMDSSRLGSGGILNSRPTFSSGRGARPCAILAAFSSLRFVMYWSTLSFSRAI